MYVSLRILKQTVHIDKESPEFIEIVPNMQPTDHMSTGVE